MQVAPSFPFDSEVRRVAMARALDRHPPSILVDVAARHRAYAGATIISVTEADDAEAVRRSLIYRLHVAPQPISVAA